MCVRSWARVGAMAVGRLRREEMCVLVVEVLEDFARAS